MKTLLKFFGLKLHPPFWVVKYRLVPNDSLCHGGLEIVVESGKFGIMATTREGARDKVYSELDKFVENECMAYVSIRKASVIKRLRWL